MGKLKSLTFMRPSGSLITLANTKEMKAFAKAQGFKIKKEQPSENTTEQLNTGDDNGNSGPSGEGNTSGDSGTGC